MRFNGKTINLQRYPNTANRSLRPWSAADELLLETALGLGLEKKNISLMHDTFGAMAVALSTYNPHSIITNASQLKATKLNLANNGLDKKDWEHSNPLNIQAKEIDIALLKIPKSADLFQLYIQQLHAAGNADSVRSEEHTSELQSRSDLVCRLLLEKKKKKNNTHTHTI